MRGAEVWNHFSHRSGDAGFLRGSGNKVLFPENLGSLENVGPRLTGGPLGSHERLESDLNNKRTLVSCTLQSAQKFSPRMTRKWVVWGEGANTLGHPA